VGAMKPKTGTKEWAEHSRNIFLGCAHNCRYCYAREIALRYERIYHNDAWPTMVLNPVTLNETPRRLKGRIMFPTTHDILPEALPVVVPYLTGWLEAGNEILIVTKPHIETIVTLCTDLSDYRDSIMFRFTIGSINDDVLNFWELGAPGYKERLESLRYASVYNYKTSVSIEPYLDGALLALVREVDPYVTDTIWVGLMNKIKRRVDTKAWTKQEDKYLDDLIGLQKVKWVKFFYEGLKNNPKIRWKDSIRQLLNLPEVHE
jgi:DNA repair photolyase